MLQLHNLEQINSLYNSGVPQNDSMMAQETNKSDAWSVVVTPTDAMADGSPETSVAVNIGNTPPMITPEHFTIAEDSFYNNDIGVSPFERFELGGDGITNFQLYGKEIVALRGYESTDIMGSYSGGVPIFDKFTLEMRYPLSLNPMSTIYALAFLEGGNVWGDINEYDPFNIKRTAGLGVRIFLPMFGLLGFDYGIGFDKEMMNSNNVFDKGKFSILLGYEPY